jgi:DNA-binding response OmpR family regulator/S1-C subfamily serine protease
MSSTPEKILIVDANTFSRGNVEDLLRGAGYEVWTTEFCHEVLELARTNKVDLVVLGTGLPGLVCSDLLSELKSASVIAGIRVILLESGDPKEKARDLDLGADDVLSRPWDPIEMLARIRRQLNTKKAEDNLRDRTVFAEKGQELSRTALQAVAATEKLSRALDRRLKAGLAALLAVAGLMTMVYFRFSRLATRETQRTYAAIAGINRGLTGQEEVIIEARKISEEMRQAESEASVPQQIIRSYAPSVCLIHLAVAFHEQASERHLHYARLTPDGEPMLDEQRNPILSLEGTGPEFLVHVLGTGFLVTAGGGVLTNHHVVEPWWNNGDLSSLTHQGLVPVISRMEVYFPGSPRPFRAVTEKISSEADLALVRVNLGDLKREILTFDDGNAASLSGEPVLLMGYPTGIDAVLARADEPTVRKISSSSHEDLTIVLAELGRRNLIRPVITQGHLGDVLPDNIIYDAQTTSGGSGGPLFNRKGKVIGINYGVIRDFGGSNFGIPARYAQAFLLGRTSR